MFAITKLVCFVILFINFLATNGNALMYLDPNDKTVWFKRILNDSIPLQTGERVVMEGKGVIAPWVVVLIHLNYEDVREQIRESVGKSFGIEEAQERSIMAEDFKPVDLNVPENPLFGEGFGGFQELVPGVKSVREYTIVSKEFNRIDKIDGYSISRWRLGDGREILGKPWTIIVVERADYSREWARDHTGIPWPFKISSTVQLVTETEVGLIDDLIKHHAGTSAKYFVPYPGYKRGAVLDLMKSIVEEASKK